MTGSRPISAGVAAAPPATDQTSPPAANSTREPATVKTAGFELSGPGRRSASGRVPARVPSLRQGSHPVSATQPAK